MVSKSLTKSSESLDERAARVAAEQAEIMQERARIDQAAHEKLVAHQRAVDEETVDSWAPRVLDKQVADARAALGRVIAEQPITQALGLLLYAETHRQVAWREMLNARSQIGLPVEGAPLPPTTGTPNIAEMVYREASAQAEDQLAEEAAARAANRTIPTEIEETE